MKKENEKDHLGPGFMIFPKYLKKIHSPGRDKIKNYFKKEN